VPLRRPQIASVLKALEKAQSLEQVSLAPNPKKVRRALRCTRVLQRAVPPQIPEAHTKRILAALIPNNPKLSVVDGVIVSILQRVEASGLKGDMANEYKFNLGVAASVTKFMGRRHARRALSGRLRFAVRLRRCALSHLGTTSTT
jgi:hypothetical protein